PETIKNDSKQEVSENQNQDAVNQNDANQDDAQSVQNSEPVQNADANYGESNSLVSKDRYEEFKRRMRDKLGNLNAGFDPEMLSIGAEMAMYHIEAGARKFANFARIMANDLGAKELPYLKSFYEAARYMPGMQDVSKEMDDTKYVNE